MAYIPPRYGPRDDWRQVLPNASGAGTGNSSNNWLTDFVIYWGWTEDEDQSPEDAWRRLRMTRDHATKALAAASPPPTPTNGAGLIPPAIARYVFGRALAKKADPANPPTLYLDPSIHVDRDATERCFKTARYRPRADWQQRLETMQPAEGSWQADLVRYWKLRLQGKQEEDAWEEVAMTPANARSALVENESSDDSGLIPCLPEGKETVARRVLARSSAAPEELNPEDFFGGLILQP